MARKKYTTVNIIGILCLLTCGAGSFYHLVPSSPETSPHMRHKALPRLSCYTLPADNPKGAPCSSIQHHIARFIDVYPFTALVGAVVLLGIGLGCLAAYLILPKQTRSEASGAHREHGHLQEKTLNNNGLPPQDIAESSKPTLDDAQYTARNVAYHEQNAHRRRFITQGATPDISPSTTSKSLTTSMQQPNTSKRSDKVAPRYAPAEAPLDMLDQLIDTVAPNKEHPYPNALRIPSHQPQSHHKANINPTQLQHTLAVLQKMIKGDICDHPTHADLRIFNQLQSLSKAPPSYAEQRWEVFRHRQKIIHIDIGYMHQYYRVFFTTFFSSDPKVKNLLLFDKVIEFFPDVSQIICKRIDNITGGIQPADYASSVVCPDFILGISDRLGKVLQNQQHQLKKIILTTSWCHQIKDDCDIYTAEFGRLGWHIGKGCKTIVCIQKAAYHMMLDDLIQKILSLIRAEVPKHEATTIDIAMFTRLMARAAAVANTKELPLDVRQRWDHFRHQQQRIDIDIEYMYQYGSVFLTTFFSSEPKAKNLLRFDKIIEIFPHLTQIICRDTDRNGPQGYATAIVGSDFLLGVIAKLHNLKKGNQLARIVIKTFKNEIPMLIDAYARELDAIGWYIQRKDSKTILLEKHPLDVISKISAMIGERRLEDHKQATPLDVAFFNKLVASQDVPLEVQQRWNSFRHRQQSLTFNMYDMYLYYNLFLPLLCSSSIKNLLLLETIVAIFPKVTEIICQFTDYTHIRNKVTKSYYSSAVVDTHFVLGIEAMLNRLAQNKSHRLSKIIIETTNIIGCHLYPTKFKELGWQIAKGRSTIVLIKKGVHNMIYKDAIAKIAAMLQAEAPPYELTALDKPILHHLFSGAKGLPPKAQLLWTEVSHQQHSITLDIESMYQEYALCRPLLFCTDKKLTNALLLDKITHIFPNITQIICQKIDCIGMQDDGCEGIYSPAVVSTDFILGLKNMLAAHKLDQLKKIIIQTAQHKIGAYCDLSVLPFAKLGWMIVKESGKQISLSRD